MCSLILHGRRFFELQKWRHLRLSVLNEFAFSTSSSSASAADLIPSRDGQKEQTFGVSYLVDTLGLTTKLAESISRKVSSKAKGDPDSVLNLLRSYGFTDSQISTIITTYPRLLVADAEKSIGPTLKFLQSRGASSSELTEIVSKVPRMLGMRWHKATGRYYDFVKDIIEADKSSKYEMSYLSLPQGSAQENIIRNVLVLRESGVPQRLLFSLLISKNHVVSGKQRFEEILKRVVEMGFDPTTRKFVKALCVVYRLSDKTIEEKVNLYKRSGFAVDDVWKMFKKYPYFLALSKKKILNSIDTYLGLGFTGDEFVMMAKHCPQCIGLSAETVKKKTELLVKKKTELLVKKMNWSLGAVASNPAVFGYSLEKRSLPRCDVVKALMSKGFYASELPSIGSVLVCTDEVFLKRFVRKHDDKKLVAELMAIFHRRSSFIDSEGTPTTMSEVNV